MVWRDGVLRHEGSAEIRTLQTRNIAMINPRAGVRTSWAS
jgi:hypothetical protein